ncbi:R3H domain-containing nucleic acid-binding protein [Candidatus Haliotispira prima]|uniref:RNA-binding protein KhpB n=1 Tax=Candidatus Haliotispira prima TaxID=3034016 RepID=A0ABY8MIL3_9SPIO|nr:R3H domain-containing nucleic acid-binding protein [Candidatus Haliotispira prima]
MYEFIGKTEQEAIERASEAMELDSSQFDVEILESEGGLFRKDSVRIRVYPHHEEQQNWLDEIDREIDGTGKGSDSGDETAESDELYNWQEIQEPKVWEGRIRDFMQELLRRMGQDGNVLLYSRSDECLLLSVQDSGDPSQLIGKHGKHLEALQVVLNAHLGRLHDEENDVPTDLRVQLDVGGYRKRREAKLVKIARGIAAQVESRRSSRLLEAMNPSERRIIHKSLNDWPNISTVSEGEGVYKQIRIIYQGSSH